MYSIECLLAIFNRSTSLKICFEIDTVESFEFVGANFRGLGGGEGLLIRGNVISRMRQFSVLVRKITSC